MKEKDQAAVSLGMKSAEKRKYVMGAKYIAFMKEMSQKGNEAKKKKKELSTSGLTP